MYRNSLQTGIISVMYSVGANPLAKWEKKTRNGHISRIADEDLRCLVIELSGSNVATTYIALPSDNALLGIRLPFLVMIVKNLKKYFTFEVQILDDKDVKRRFRVSSYQTTTKVHSYACTMPIMLQPGWNQVQFDLEKFTRKAFGTGFVEAARLQKSKSLFGVGQGYDIDRSENNIEYYPEATSTLDETTENNEAKRQKQVEELKETIYDHIRNIRDPEKPATLEDLNVVYEDGVMIKQSTADGVNSVRIEFNPTVPHCSLATLIGLCIRVKLERNLEVKIKLDIYIKKGTHSTEEEINKQINDKERIAAAMENPDLRELVEGCIQEED